MKVVSIYWFNHPSKKKDCNGFTITFSSILVHRSRHLLSSSWPSHPSQATPSDPSSSVLPVILPSGFTIRNTRFPSPGRTRPLKENLRLLLRLSLLHPGNSRRSKKKKKSERRSSSQSSNVRPDHPWWKLSRKKRSNEQRSNEKSPRDWL